MDFKFGNYALLLSFLRIKLGKEFEVARRLGNEESSCYYTCYGQYDLIQMLTVDSYESIHNVPFDGDIVDCDISLFYPCENISEPVHIWSKRFPVLLISFLKFHPDLEKNVSLEIENIVINHIKKGLKNNANIFFGLGRSELLLIYRGTNFEKMLPVVSRLRQNLLIGKVFKGENKLPHNTPIFISSTTFPAIAHPALKGESTYNKLDGRVFPSVYIACYPGYEKLISHKKPASCSSVQNIYGSYDVFLKWDKPIKLSDFANELTQFRHQLSEIDGVLRSTTSLIGPEIKPHKSLSPRFSKSKGTIYEMPFTKDVLEKAINLSPFVKAQLLEFLGRLNSYCSTIEFNHSFQDMVGIHHSILWVLSKLENVSVPQRFQLETHLSQIIDLGNTALYERYAGLENRFQTSRHLPFPFLRGINVFLNAASAIPCFVFKSLSPDLYVRDSWAGFVLFGQSYSYKLLSGRVLSYHSNSLHRPIEDWWGITHEIAHAIYWSSEFYDKILPPDIKRYFDDVTNSNTIPFFVDVEEIYAQWFDFKYIFAGDITSFLPKIWKSWLRWDLIWKYRINYIFRSFVIYICSDLDKFDDARNISYKEGITYLRTKFEEMKKLIRNSVPEFVDFINIEIEKDFESFYTAIKGVEGYLYFLDKSYFDEAFFKRLNPTYPEELLNKHINSLKNGTIVTENIPSPIKLLKSCYEKYSMKDKEVPFIITSAIIRTLNYYYMQNYMGE